MNPLTRPKVLYLTGMMRCGSTMIGNVLNEVPGAVHVGELHYLWRNGILGTGTNSSCGCGEPVTGCPLWSAVLAAGGTAAGEDEARAMIAAQDRRFRARHTAARLGETLTPLSPPSDVRWATDVTKAVYDVVLDRSDSEMVVDSSKYPAEAAALLGREDLDVKVLHVVRDPRATAFSYRKDKSYVTRMGAVRSTAYWSAVNAASDLLALRGGDRYLRVRHEDFGRDPAGVIAAIQRFAGLDAPNPVTGENRVRLGINHTVTGNPDRLNRGEVVIGCDERWRSELEWKPRVLTTAGAGLQMLRYRYTPGDKERTS
jgi:hypothetical protein